MKSIESMDDAYAFIAGLNKGEQYMLFKALMIDMDRVNREEILNMFDYYRSQSDV